MSMLTSNSAFLSARWAAIAVPKDPPPSTTTYKTQNQSTYNKLLQKFTLYNLTSTKHCIKLHLERTGEIEEAKKKKKKKTLLVRSRTSVLALERQERDQRSSFSHANRTARRRSLTRSGVGSGSWKSG
jgi:hypothetical protein